MTPKVFPKKSNKISPPKPEIITISALICEKRKSHELAIEAIATKRF
jgi:hypothetical protein